MTNPTGYIATDTDHTAIHGIGYTADEALIDAAIYNAYEAGQSGIVIYPADAKLMRQVKLSKVPVEWELVDGAACLLE